MNHETVEQAKQEGIWQFVCECSPYDLRVIVLTDGHRGSMLKRELDPLELQAREWVQVATADEIANCKQQAYEIMRAKFANVNKPADLIPALLQVAPADYDDSEIALGKQRIAQIERMRESDNRKFDLSDV